MPVNANFYYKTAKDASYVTLRNQNRMLYANYRMQQNNVQQGCQGVMRLQDGGVADADIIPKLLEGARETTAIEILIDISSNACPVTIPVVIVDPYLSDKIYLALTTNAAAYKAAAVNTWIAVTSTEYAALKTALSGTTTVGASNANMALDYSFSNLGPNGFASISYDGTNTIAIPASSYFIAVSFVYDVNNQTGNALWINSSAANATTRTGFVKQGGNLPATVVPSGRVIQYYVIKGQNTATTSGGTSAFAISDANSVNGGLRFASGVATTYYLFTASPSSSTTLSSSVPHICGMQGVVASSVQWVTS